MNFHEYQAKELFASSAFQCRAGNMRHHADEAVDAAEKLGGDQWVIKAQIHAGGRGKAGGVKLVKDAGRRS
jgi:succinyl-CoA synthetase beta subunit